MSDMDSAGATTPGMHVISEHPGGDGDDLTPAPELARAPEREGLPSTYRMRADAHYVDQLSGRRGDAPAREPVEPARPAEVAARGEDRDRRMARLLDELTEQVASIESAAQTLSGPGSALVRRAGIDVVTAHAWRASWLLRAARLADGTHGPRLRLRQIGPLLSQVRERLASELRLKGCSLHVIASDWNTSVEVDDSAFVTGLTGGVLATLGLAGEAEGTAVRLTVKTASGDLQAVEIVQDDATIGETVIARFFDPEWTDRPGGWPASLGAAALRAFATTHGGRAVLTGGRRGSTIRVDFGY